MAGDVRHEPEAVLRARDAAGGLSDPRRGADDLAGRCRLGYRAKWIRAIADLIVGGALDLEVGPFAHANILQLFGRTDALPFDTETCRLWAEEHGASTEKKRRRGIMREAEAYYRARYPRHEWQACWSDLWRNYNDRRGAEGPRWTIPSQETSAGKCKAW